MTSTGCTITAQHCSNCGSTDLEDVASFATEDGYSNCCNEPVSAGSQYGCRNNHAYK